MLNASLPQVAALAHTTLMAEILARDVFDGAAVSSCRILHFRYKPGSTWIVSYSVQMSVAAGEQIVYLRAAERRGSYSRYSKSLALGQNVRHIPCLDSVAWLFPSDRKLSGLPALLDIPRVCAEVLPAIAARSSGITSPEIVHYLPERSCMVRYDIRNSQKSAVVVYGKAYPDGEGRQTFDRMTQLWQAGVPIARPLLYEPERAILWQQGLEGGAPGLKKTATLRRAAETLAALHRSHVAGLAPYPDASSRLDSAAQVIVTAAPDQRDFVLAVKARLQALRPRLSPRPPATLHGDLHPKNFILTANRSALIDLDTLAAGDPVEDLAAFSAALFAAGLAAGVPESHTRRRLSDFIAAYELCAHWTVPAFDLAWHIAAALITERALRAVTRMKADLPSLGVLLNLAAQFTATAERAVAATGAPA